jgi:hypothetical protein
MTTSEIAVAPEKEPEAEFVDTSTTSLVLSSESMDRIYSMANLMANGRATIPKHLQNNPADCAAIVMQSMQWGMNPFAVAQKTHVTQGGALGYEGQLVNAVIVSKLGQRPEYQFLGDWSKILGRVEERKSENSKGKYYVAAWNKADEQGLGVICSMLLPGESQPRSIQVMLTQAYPRFSTQWATDPQQQICFLAVRKFARRYTPDVILGVYTPEELFEVTPARDMGSADVVQPPADLLAQATAAAERGVAAYQDFFQNTSKENRKALAPEHEGLKKKAQASDAARTVDNTQQQEKPAEGDAIDVDFVEEMDKAEAAQKGQQEPSAGDDDYVPQ